ncbi:hypothetical protein HF086_007076 [Spodoptera exigua]|uniref:Uncharacterized protein n=1 Tax=Spodoptera exigua TaxID=7107 RepID=A0A922SKE2_SPOEX|nr:hypothetical protein HF086_007076 [Spodoptera exigua]
MHPSNTEIATLLYTPRALHLVKTIQLLNKTSLLTTVLIVRNYFKTRCGIRPDGKGFRVRTFQSECELEKYNCEVKENFTITDYFICSNNPNAEGKNEEHKKDELEIMLEDSVNETNNDRELQTMLKEDDVNNTNAFKNVVIVRGSVLNGRNINKSIANFFKSTLNQGIPIRSVLPGYNESTRKRMIKIFGPVKLYEPRVVKPKIVHEDYYHQPTLSSCFHKCPTVSEAVWLL